MDFSCSHLTLDDRKMRSAALLGQSWLMPFFECWMWRKRTLTDDLVIQNPGNVFESMQFVCVYNSHCMHWYSNLWCDLLKMKDTYLITKSKYSHSFPGLSTVSKGAVRIGGFGTAHALRCFLLPPPRNVLHSSEVQEFAMFTGLFCTRLGGFPCQLGEKTIHWSCYCCIVAPEMFELLAVNFQTQNTSFFFQSFWEFNLGFLWARRIWWQWWGVARAVPSPWAQQFHLRGQWNGGLISTDKLKIIDPLMVLCQVNCCILNWIYLHILITHCTMTITISCLYEGTLIVWINVYTARIYSQYSTFLSDFTLYTTKITNFEHFSTFKHHLKKVFCVS